MGSWPSPWGDRPPVGQSSITSLPRREGQGEGDPHFSLPTCGTGSVTGAPAEASSLHPLVTLSPSSTSGRSETYRPPAVPAVSTQRGQRRQRPADSLPDNNSCRSEPDTPQPLAGHDWTTESRPRRSVAHPSSPTNAAISSKSTVPSALQSALSHGHSCGQPSPSGP